MARVSLVRVKPLVSGRALPYQNRARSFTARCRWESSDSATAAHCSANIDDLVERQRRSCQLGFRQGFEVCVAPSR